MKNPPEGCQRVEPYLMYADAAAALTFLVNTFGFEERLRMAGEDGVVMHAEVGYQDNVVMLGTDVKDMGLASPRDLPARHGSVLCYVDDVDTHHAHAKTAGAKIHAEPEDKFDGDRMYSAEDLEGHHWYFATHVKDVAPEDMHPPEP